MSTALKILLTISVLTLSSCIGQVTNNIDSKIDANVNASANVNANATANTKVDTNIKTGDIGSNNSVQKSSIKQVVSILTSLSDISLNIGDSSEISANVKFNDNSTNNNISYVSSNSSIAKIDTSGKITGISEGNTTIIVSSKEDVSKSSVINVKVLNKDTNNKLSSVVSTIAGSQERGFNDGIGINAKFTKTEAIAVDNSGNIFVADAYRVRKITANGVVSTIAGSTLGDLDGIGVNAKFKDVNGIAVDKSGNIFVTDAANHKIKKITPEGVVSTIAGSTSGDLDGIGTNAKFDYPYCLTLDKSGNIFVTDYSYDIKSGMRKIKKITPEGVVSTIAGSISGDLDEIGINAKFNYITGIVVDDSGNIFILDEGNRKIKKMIPTGLVTTIGLYSKALESSGSSMGTAFDRIELDSLGNIIFANNNTIKKITANGIVTTIAGSGEVGYLDGTLTNSQFRYPSGLAVDKSGNIFVTDWNMRVRKILL